VRTVLFRIRYRKFLHKLARLRYIPLVQINMAVADFQIFLGLLSPTEYMLISHYNRFRSIRAKNKRDGVTVAAHWVGHPRKWLRIGSILD
jgi:hypothetical protein